MKSANTKINLAISATSSQASWRFMERRLDQKMLMMSEYLAHSRPIASLRLCMGIQNGKPSDPYVCQPKAPYHKKAPTSATLGGALGV